MANSLEVFLVLNNIVLAFCNQNLIEAWPLEPQYPAKRKTVQEIQMSGSKKKNTNRDEVRGVGRAKAKNMKPAQSIMISTGKVILKPLQGAWFRRRWEHCGFCTLGVNCALCSQGSYQQVFPLRSQVSGFTVGESRFLLPRWLPISRRQSLYVDLLSPSWSSA